MIYLQQIQGGQQIILNGNLLASLNLRVDLKLSDLYLTFMIMH
jgi:hypothetical protein